MPHNITGTNTYTDPVPALSDGDPVAESSNDPSWQALANRDTYLKTQFDVEHHDGSGHHAAINADSVQSTGNIHSNAQVNADSSINAGTSISAGGNISTSATVVGGTVHSTGNVAADNNVTAGSGAAVLDGGVGVVTCHGTITEAVDFVNQNPAVGMTAIRAFKKYFPSTPSTLTFTSLGGNATFNGTVSFVTLNVAYAYMFGNFSSILGNSDGFGFGSFTVG